MFELTDMGIVLSKILPKAEPAYIYDVKSSLQSER